MSSILSFRPLLILAAPLLLAALLTFADRDLMFTLPLTGAAAFMVSGISLLGRPDGRWWLHCSIAGVVGFLLSVAALLSIQI